MTTLEKLSIHMLMFNLKYWLLNLYYGLIQLYSWHIMLFAIEKVSDFFF